MSVYLTPGTYLRPQPPERKDVRLVRTDVAGFVGFTERGPLPAPGIQPGSKTKAEDLALRLTSWKEFTIHFGGFIPFGSLAYAVRAFFDNGGTTCYVVRVAANSAEVNLDALGRPHTASIALPGDEPIAVGRLVQAVGKGENKLVLDTANRVQVGNLVAIASEGVTEFYMVTGSDGPTVNLGRNTKTTHAAGDVVFQYPAKLNIRAVSAGNWGNRVRLDITPLQDGPLVDEFSLRVTVNPGFYLPETKQEEIYNRLTLNKDDKANARFYAPDVINQNSQLIRLEGPQPNFFVGKTFASKLTAGPVKSGPVYLQGGRDGLAGIKPLDFTGGPDQFWGLRLLAEIDEVAILCAPDAVFEAPPVGPTKTPPSRGPCDPPPSPDDKADPLADDPTAIPSALDEADVFNIYQTMLDQCERLRDRVAIIDPPAALKPKQAVQWRNNFNSRFGALYYPWLKVPDSPGQIGSTRQVPPSGHVAGVYARIDNQFGVHRPPANVPLEFIDDVADEITALLQEELNPFDVNAIRSFSGRGIRVWGARSLAKNDLDWRFIHARRLMSMIEESVYKSMQWAVFEPNDFSLRRTLVHSLSVFLEQIWRQGGLKGALPAEAFFVKCDETNNPRAVIDAGQIVCQVGIAVAAPMEFIVFEIRRGPSGAQITET